MSDITISSDLLLVIIIPCAFSAGIFLVRNEQQHKEARKDINNLCTEVKQTKHWIKKLLNHSGCPFDEDEVEK